MFTNGENLTADELHAVLRYDPLTGDFTWSETPRRGVRSGQPAGHKASYHRIRIHRVEYKAQRLAWLYAYGHWPDGVVDHVNGNPLDNRLANLRVGTQKENLYNRGPSRTNTTGYKGVSKITGYDLWRATIGGKHVGTFKNPEDAAAAYQAEAKIRIGDFASW